MSPPDPVEQQASREESGQKHRTGLVTLLFTDMVGSTALKQQLGDRAGAAFFDKHHRIVRAVLARFPQGQEMETAGDSFLILFGTPSDAVQFALLLQARLRKLKEESPVAVLDRIGIHIGEVVIKDDHTSAKPKDLYGIQIDTCSRVMSLAQAGQVLMTRSVFDSARQVLKGEDIAGFAELNPEQKAAPLVWLNHGPYLLKGLEEPVEICEVREASQATFSPPTSSDKAQRQVHADEEQVLGWRPAVGQFVPNTRWLLEKKLGEGGFGEVWLGRHQTMKERRVFKFCFRADRVRSLKREMTLFRVLKERVGDHPNIVALRDVYFEEPPFYVVMDHVEGQDLKAWCEQESGVEKVPLAVRLEIVAQIADALQAAHDAGVIHRDVKPGNILVAADVSRWADISSSVGAAESQPTDSRPQLRMLAKLTDFGIGQVVSEEALKGMTKAGFTETLVADSSSSQTGSQMYMAPELLAGKPASTRSDIYSLGVVLYQLLVGDLTRPLTTDWADHIADPLLRDDLKHCFAGNPQDRFAGAGQLAKNLRALPQRQAAHAAQQAEQAVREQAAYRRGVLRTAALATVLVVTFAGLALVAMKKWREAALAREHAEEAARKLSLDNYTADMKVVQAAIGENNRGRAVDILQKYPKPGDEDLRGLEWRYLWRQAQGDETHTFHGSGGPVNDAIFSPNDGGLLATIDHDDLDEVGTVKVWDVASKQLVFKFAGKPREGMPGSGSLIAFSPDGKNLAAILGNSITIWETDRWQALTNLQGALQSLVYSPDGKILAACVDGGVRLWDTANWRTNFLPTGLKPEKWALAAISPDSRLLATAESTQPIQVWDLASLSKIDNLKSQSGWIVSLAFSTKENLLAAADWEGVLRIWDLATREQLVTNLTQASFITGMSFSPDGKTLALAGADQSIRLLDVATQRPLATLRGHLKEVWKVVYSPNGQFLASASKDGTAKLWNAVRGPEADDLWNEPSGAAFMGIERGAGLLMYSSTNQPVEFWKVADGKAAKSFSLNIEPEDRWHVRCSPDGRLAAIGKTNGVVELYDCASARRLKPLKVGEDLFVPLAISADNKWLVLNRDKDSRLRVLDLEAGTQIFTVQADNSYGDISAIFSPNGRLLAYKGPQFSVQLREIATGRELTLRGHRWAISTLNFSQDGKLLVSTGIDDEARIWDVTTGRQFAPPLKGHTQGLRFAQFTPDVRTVLTTDQRTVRLWNAINGQEMVSIKDAGDFMLAADGNTLVLRTIDGKRRLVRIPTLAEIDAMEKANAK